MGAEQAGGTDVAPDVRLELTHAPGGPGVLADGRPLSVPPHASPTEVGLAAVRRHAARSGRELRVEVVDGGSVTLVAVSLHGAVTLLEPPATQPMPRVVPEPVTEADRTAVHVPVPPALVPPGQVPPAQVLSAPAATTPPLTVPPTSVWASPAPATRPRRPVSSLVVASLIAVAVLVGAVGTGVATLSSSQALPGSCRPVTLYAVDGQGGSTDVLRGVTDPLSKQFGEKVSVVTVPAPPAGGSFASAESEAVTSLATAMGEHVDGCPTGSLMLFGYSQGAQVAGDLASRVGTGLEPRIPANLVQAVGLFGDPARSPRTRAVPDGTTGQGALPPRAVGFGALDARTIEICAPGDPVCDSPATAASPPLEQAVASPVHGSYQQLPVAAGTTAPQWAAASLGKVVAAIPTDAGPAATATPGTAPQSGPVTTTTPGSGQVDAGTGTGSGTATTGTGDIDDGGVVASGSPGTGSDPTTGTGGDAATTSTGGDATTGTGGPDAVTTAPRAGTGSAGTGSAGTSGSYGDGGSYGDNGSAGASGDASATDGGSAGGAAVSPTTTARPGSSATGGTGAGAGASTRRSGSASSSDATDGTGTAGSGSSGSPTSSSGDASAGSDPGGYGGSSSGTVSPGRGSGSRSQTSTAAPTTPGTTSSGSGTSSSGTVSSGQGSAGSGSASATGSGTASTDPTTTTSKTKRGSGGAGTGGSGTGGTGSTTDAAFSLTDGLDGFKSTPWNNQNATDPSAAPSPNVQGRQAVKFEMPGGGKRTEAEPDVPEFTEGQKAFVGYSGFFGKGFPTNTDTWQLIMQFKQPGTGSPPLAVEVGKGQLRLANDGGNEKDFCPVGEGAFSFQLGITFGGAIDAWCNGKQTLTGYSTPKPNVQGSAYLKTGIYRDEAITQDSTLFLDDLKVGKTLESVSGLAGATTTAPAGATGTSAEATPGTGTAGSGVDSGSGAVAAPAAAPTGSDASGAGAATDY